MENSTPRNADVIVAGGGSAGCALAARLSEDPRLRIVLVEAGRIALPAASPKTFPPRR